MNWFDRLIQLLERYLPAFLVGWKIGQAGKEKLAKENTNLKLELEGVQDAKRIEDRNRALSDDELHDEMLRGLAGKSDKK